jgi:predicted nucleotidyltransferase
MIRRSGRSGIVQPIIDTHRAELAALGRRFHVRRLDLFGSAATGEFDQDRSDLDFLVLFDPLPPAAYAKAYFGLHEALAGLFKRNIDLLTEPSLTNPYLRAQIEAERRTLFDAAA